MKLNQINLFIRFLLEICLLTLLFLWGLELSNQWYRYLFATSFVLIIASIWGIFAVKNDPSRSGNTVIETPGYIRLILELVIFAFGIFILYDLEFTSLSIFFLLIVITHYLISYKRIIWLLKN